MGGCASVAALVALLAFGGQAHAITFASPQGYPATGSGTPQDLTLGDLTGDKRPEIVVGVRPQFDTEQPFFTVNANSGSGTFGSPSSTGVGSGEAVEGVAVGDVGGDGDTDVATGNRNGEGVLFFGNGAGGFPSTVGLSRPEDVGSVLAPVVADFTGDHVPDVASGNEGPLTLYKGHSDNTVGGPKEYGSGVNASASVAADVDRDGDRDIVVGGLSGSGGLGGALALLRNRGGGKFAAPSVKALGTGGVDVAAADVLGTRALEVIARAPGAESLCVHAVKRKGLGKCEKFGVPAGGGGLVATDLDGDKRADVAVGAGGSNIAVLRGKQAGGLRGYQTFASLDTVGDLAAADLNGDRRPDLVGLSGQAVVLINEP
jgi:FG-GAP-like repeat